MKNNQLIIFQTEKTVESKLKHILRMKYYGLISLRLESFFKSQKQLLASISRIYLMTVNWKNNWLFGIYEQPLNTV